LGYECRIDPGLELPFSVVDAGGKFVLLRNTSKGYTGFTIPSYKLLRLLATTDAGTIMVAEYSMNSALALIFSRLRSRQFWIFQEAGRKRSRIKQLMARLIASRADLIVANSGSAERDLRENLGVVGESILRAPLLSAPPRL